MVLKRIRKRYDLDQVMDKMDPLVQKWFRGKFKDLTEPQAYAIPLIHKGVNVLVSSPTGSGKTITAFLSIINELLQLHKNGKLEDRIYCVYISPLKALANDVNKNLKEPLSEMAALAKELGMDPPNIRVAVRSGDTSNYERQKMARLPPHIFITTPESISLVLSTPKFSQNFKYVRYVIVDEIHEISNSKRGVYLSLNLERLQNHVDVPFTRIGLSATQAPIEEIAKFLVGYNRGRVRDCSIVQASMVKDLDLGIICPVNDMTTMPFEVVNQKMYDRLEALILGHKTTLVFTNTRSGTERVVCRLKENGIERIAAHHGSLSRETRLQVEDDLRNGKLQSVVTSTSLELGIDIGHIDLVCQIGSPKSVAKGIQRIGRSGHNIDETARGRFLVIEKDDLVELAVIVKSAMDGKIDRISILKNSLDVLAQVLVGMSLEDKWEIDSAYKLVKGSYCFKDLKRSDFKAVIDYLAGKYRVHEGGYGRIWLDETEGLFGSKRGTRMIYYLNLGTIPEEASYRVLSNKGPLGKLSEKFVERLSSGDVFVLGGKTYEFDKSRGMSIFVKDAQGRRPTVPSWTGEMLPRSFDLSIDIGRFRSLVEKRMKKERVEGEVEGMLMNDFRLDEGSAKTIYSYFKEQMAVAPVPTDKRLLIEGYRDPQGNYNIIFHFCFGRRVSEALARAYATALSQKENMNVKVSLTDDNFMLTVPRAVELDTIQGLVTPKNLESLLRGAITSTEMFKQRFRHCAMRAFMILRNFKGKDIPVSRQLRHSARLLEAIGTNNMDPPVIRETYNEILHDAMDLDNAMAMVKGISSHKIKIEHIGYSEVPSPFAHNIVLIGASDMLLMEDRSGLLRDMHKQVLSKIMAYMPQSTLDPLLVQEYYRSKVPTIENKDDIVPLMKVMGPMHVLQERGENIFTYSTYDFDTTRRWATELIREGEIVSIWRDTLHWVPAEYFEIYSLLYARPHRTTTTNKKVLATIDKVDPDKRTSRQVKALEEAFLIERYLDEAGKLHFRQRSKYNVQKRLFGPNLAVTGLDDALRVVLRNTLEFNEPMSLQEISFKLSMDESLIESGIADLGPEVSTIQLEGTTRFLLSKDKVRLQDRKKVVFGEREIRRFIIKKHFFSCNDISDFYDRFYEANMTLDIFNRVKEFDLATWWKDREAKNILEGRFVKNRVGYLKREVANLMNLVSIRPKLDPVDYRVLKAIQDKPGAGLWDLVKQFEGRFPKAVVKESVDKLDHGLYVIRVQREHGEWPTRNLYEAFGPGNMTIIIPKDDQSLKGPINKRRGRPPKKKKKVEAAHFKDPVSEEDPNNRSPKPSLESNPYIKLVQRCIDLYGPAPVQLIRYHTGLGYETIHQTIDVLETTGSIVRASLVDGSTQEVFMSLKDLDELKAMPRSARFKDRLRILSQYDPYVRRIWLEVVNKFGEGWFFPAIKDGKLCGMVEMWNLSGCIEVREICLDDEDLLPALLKELDRHLEYHKMFGTEVLRVRKALGMAIEEMKPRLKKVFTKYGYLEIQGMLVKGKVRPEVFSRERVLAYIFHRQHLTNDNKFKDTFAAIKGLGGLHSEFEIESRVRIFHPIKKYKDKLASCLAIPEYLTFCTWPDLMLYKSAKDRALNPDMEKALSVIRESGALGRRELQKRLSMDAETFNKTVKDLYTSLHIFKDQRNMFVPTDNPEITPTEARRMILDRTVSNFGIISAEKIASYTKHEFKMREIRGHLKTWEDEGRLVKGYFVEGDETLYWLLKEDLEKLPTYEAKGERVLTPTDPVSQYLSQEAKELFNIGTCYLIFQGTRIIGAFKATKRSGTLAYTEFIGDAESKAMVQRFGRRWGLKVTQRKEVEPEDDWDLMLWYEKRKIPGE